jgi:hypothetical protein
MFNGLQGSKVMRQSGVETLITEEPDDRIGHVRICGGCALKAHEVQQSEMTAQAKPSQQPGTESCVVSGNGHCEA